MTYAMHVNYYKVRPPPNNNTHAVIGSPKAAATPQQHGSSSTATMASVTSAATTAPAVINSTEATPVERSTKQFDRIRATKPPHSAPSNQNLLRLDRANLLTRREIAALVLPRVASISNDDIMLALDQTEVKTHCLLVYVHLKVR